MYAVSVCLLNPLFMGFGFAELNTVGLANPCFRDLGIFNNGFPYIFAGFS